MENAARAGRHRVDLGWQRQQAAGSGLNRIAPPGGRSGQLPARLGALAVDPVLAPVRLDLGLRVERADRLCHGLFAMAASHAGDGEDLLHQWFLSVEWMISRRSIARARRSRTRAAAS